MRTRATGLLLLAPLAALTAAVGLQAGCQTAPTADEPEGCPPPFLAIYVDAPELDPASFADLARTQAQGAAENGFVGHAWLRLEDDLGVVRGGLSSWPRPDGQPYLAGILQRAREGHPDPIAYLWAPVRQGRYQAGSGGHWPTYAACFPITGEQARAVRAFLAGFDTSRFSPLDHQCTTYVAGAAQVAGLELDCWVTAEVPATAALAGREVRLWTDPAYSRITYAAPQKLQAELERLVAQRRGRRIGGR